MVPLRSFVRNELSLALLLLPAILLLWQSTGRADVDSEQVQTAIDRAVAYLKRQQGEDGTWQKWLTWETTSLTTLALLNAGVPADDPAIRKAMTHIRKSRALSTYIVSLNTMVLCAAEPQKDLAQIRTNTQWLVEKQQPAGANRAGMWSYPGGLQGDNSNTQFALLALYEADRALARFVPDEPSPIPEKTWQLALDHWQKSQNEDGSWGYTPGDNDGTGSMTSAGIASVILCSDRLRTAAASVDGEQVKCCGAVDEKDSVQRALTWLGRRDIFSISKNPGEPHNNWLYYLYALERAGRLTGSREIGDVDWFQEAAGEIINKQAHAGRCEGIGRSENQPVIATALALLFLSKGRTPVVVGKLKYGKGNSGWNRHPRDLDHLVEHVAWRWKKNLTWQIVDGATATTDDYRRVPVLLIAGDGPLEGLVNDQQKIKDLRTYIDSGGFILAEACCNDPRAFDESFRDLMTKMFPEPELRLRQIAPEHKVWSIDELPGPEFAGKLFGIDVGGRTCVIYCRDIDEPFAERARGLSCFWELAAPGHTAKLPGAMKTRAESAFSLGTNVLTYATGKEVKTKDMFFPKGR